MSEPKKLAVLIDADNSSHKNITLILQEIVKLGLPTVKRVYGDWSGEISDNGKTINRLYAWRDVSLEHAITPIHQFSYTKGKDATDMMLIINAMDLLYGGAIDGGFCLVSSDSDFTPLASRIRESGLKVYGFGERKTPSAFVNACDKFIYVENLTKKEEDVAFDGVDHQLQTQDVVSVQEIDNKTLQLIFTAIKDTADDDGWADLSVLGQRLVALKPDFDPRTYGRAKLSGLLKQLGLFIMQERGSQKFVRKRTSFSKFLKLVDGLIKERYGVGQWIEMVALTQTIDINPNEYGFCSVPLMFESINSKSFELSDDKTQIRLVQ